MRALLLLLGGVTVIVLLTENTERICGCNRDRLDPSDPEYFVNLVTRPGPRVSWVEQRELAEGAMANSRYYAFRAELAIALVHLGEPERAREVIRKVERGKTADFMRARDVATAFELVGHYREALGWVREGRERGYVGEGKTWERLLEARLALEADPSWLETQTVLGLDFGDGGVPGLPEGYTSERLRDEVLGDLLRSLSGRLESPRVPDPVIADLLFDLGNVLALTRTSEHALPFYDLAHKYGPAREELVRRRRDRAASPGAWASRWAGKASRWVGVFFATPLGGLCVLASITVLVWFVALRRAPVPGEGQELDAEPRSGNSRVV